jgi:hypothetical protein
MKIDVKKPCKRCGSYARYLDKNGKKNGCVTCRRADCITKKKIKSHQKKGFEITKDFEAFLRDQSFKRIFELDQKKEKNHETTI